MEENECMICLEDMKTDIAVLSCGHIFHFSCISCWANKKKDLQHVCTICTENSEIVNVVNIEEVPKVLHYIEKKKRQLENRREKNGLLDQKEQLEMYKYQKDRLTYYESEDMRQPEQPKAKFCAIM